MSKDEAARKLFAQSCECLLAAAVPEQFPDTPLPEVAFIGRSNVGKSSLINALTGRKSLARASNTPGRTQQIVFFNLNQKLMIVDLPGYGHAEAPAGASKQWNSLTRHYLKNRPNLRLVCLLIDSRHGAKDNDISMMDFLDSVAVNYQVVLTKADQIPDKEKEQKTKQANDILKEHPAARTSALLTSANKVAGISELQMLLAEMATNPD